MSLLSTLLVMTLVTPDPAQSRGDQLIEAARQGDLKQVKELVAGGVDVDSQLKFGITALWQAASKGHREVVEFLLASGADPNVRDGVWNVTPMLLSDDRQIIQLLIKHGAKGADAKLRTAALSGSREMVAAILGVQPVPDAWLAAAKAQALLGKHEEIAKQLDEAARKPLPNPPSVSKETLARYAGKYLSERLEVLELRVEEGQLRIRESGGRSRQLAPRDERTFDLGPLTIAFEMSDGQVKRLTRSSPFSSRVYTPARDGDQAGATKRPAALSSDDWRGDIEAAARDVWPSFRGLGARGIAAGQNLPARWDGDQGENVRWKTRIPGLGNACPVVWRNKVFVATAVSTDGNDKLKIGLYGAGDAANDNSVHSWRLYCLDHATGKVLWQRVAHEGVPPIKRHTKSSQANSTPATDGEHVVALFNSGGLYCYDMQGELLWSRDLGVLDSGAFNDADYQWGFGSSPIIHGRSVIVQCDLQKGSFMAAFEVKTGEPLWRTPRDELPSWGTPTVHQTTRGPLLIANATNFVCGYDARTGDELWRLGRNAAITVPTPIVGHGMVFVTSGYRPIQPIYAVRLEAVGDITLKDGEESNQHIVWSKDRGGPYLPTPILYGDYLYTCANNGVFTCYLAKTGERIYRRRCGGGSSASFTASPVAADGRIYVTSEAGKVFVLEAGPEFKVLAENALGEYCLTTPAIAGGALLFRTHRHLLAVGK